jgi:hypothetical protein
VGDLLPQKEFLSEAIGVAGFELQPEFEFALAQDEPHGRGSPVGPLSDSSPGSHIAFGLSFRSYLLSRDAFFGGARLVLHIYRKYLEIGEGVPSVKAVASEIHIEFRTGWKPKL